jgi:antitoxin VapB
MGDPSDISFAEPAMSITTVFTTRDEFFLNGPRASDDFMAERAWRQQSERVAF